MVGSESPNCAPQNTLGGTLRIHPYCWLPARSGGREQWGWGVGENGVGTDRGWNSATGSGVQLGVNEVLENELDAYLDRELASQPDTQPNSLKETATSAERLQVLALASEEEQWLRTLPPEQSADGEKEPEVPLPEHLKAKKAPQKPAPVVPAPLTGEPAHVVITYVPVQPSLPGLMTVPVPAQPWPAPAPARRGRWLAAGAVAGVSMGVLAAGLLWLAREPLPEGAQVTQAQVTPRVPVAVAPAPAVKPEPRPTLFVENSPLQRAQPPVVPSWDAAEPLPGPMVPGRAVASQAAQPVAPVASEPKAAPVATAAVAQVKVEPVPEEASSASQLGEVTGAMARASQRLGPVESIGPSTLSEPVRSEKPELTASVKAQAPRAAAAKPEQRRLIEDPYLDETEEAELPFVQQPRRPAPAPAPVAKAAPAPQAPSQTNEYEDLDEAFAREMGFTPGSKPRTPEPTGVKSVWIPPDPASNLPESLTPEQVQQVVVANQPAIVSCIKRFKDSVPGVSGGKFVVRWFVHPDGSTYGQMVETRQLRGTALGTCIERLVPTWKFPQHRVQQQTPIRFPFVF